jgi:hypothetical protein
MGNVDSACAGLKYSDDVAPLALRGFLTSSVPLNGSPCTVVGVMSPEFAFPPGNEDVQLFLPLEDYATNTLPVLRVTKVDPAQTLRAE